jgi:hypothetical protein
MLRSLSLFSSGGMSIGTTDCSVVAWSTVWCSSIQLAHFSIPNHNYLSSCVLTCSTRVMLDRRCSPQVGCHGRFSRASACGFSRCQLHSYLVDPASSYMLVSKTKPCMSKYKPIYTVKLRMAHYISYCLFDDTLPLG